jgi:hypothetical protein
LSTKIYTGFRMNARTMRAALDALESVSSRCEKLLETRQARHIAQVATRQIDKLALAGLPGYPAADALKVDFSPVRKAWDLMDDRQAEVRKTRRRDPDVDYEVIFRVWLCRQTNAFVGYVAGEDSSAILEVLFKSRVAHEYGYWNNTDEPEHLNQRQWKKRAKVWEGLIAGKSGPCFEVRVREPYMTWGAPERVLAALPTYEERVARYTRDVALNRWFAEVKGASPEIDPIPQYFKFRDLQEYNDPVVVAHLAAARELVLERLAPTVTRQMLLGV